MKRQIVSLISLSMVLSAAVLQGQEKRDSLKEKAIEEVVLVNVGYGTQKKAHLTGAIATVPMDDIQDLASGNLASTLSGMVNGLSVSGGDARPGALPAAGHAVHLADEPLHRGPPPEKDIRLPT